MDVIKTLGKLLGDGSIGPGLYAVLTEMRRDSASPDHLLSLGKRVTALEDWINPNTIEAVNARLAALEAPRTAPPPCGHCGQPRHAHAGKRETCPGMWTDVLTYTPATPLPAPDCAAEALPVVWCSSCGDKPATRIELTTTGDKMHLLNIAAECDGEYTVPSAIYITGEPAARILRDIAREAAHVRQGGAW